MALACARLIAAGALAAAGVSAGTLAGRVVEDHSGTPMGSAGVRIFPAAGGALAADLDTDGQGRFEAAELPAGEYRIDVSKPSYVSTTLRVRVGNASSPVLVRLVRCGAFVGQVTDLEGQPVRDAFVYTMVKTAGGGPFRRFGAQEPGKYSQVDERGQYRLYNLPPGQYAVAAAYGATSMMMSMKGSASAHRTAGSGVLFYPNNDRPQVFTISGGEEFRADFAILPAAVYTASGKVEPRPAASVGIWVTLTPLDQPALAAATTEAAPDGSFRFEGIGPGSYELYAWGPLRSRGGGFGQAGPQPLYGRTRVEVGAQNVEGILIPMEKGRSASFMMRPASGQQPDKGCPATAQLSLAAVEDHALRVERRPEVSFVKEAIVDDLPPGRYYATLSNLGENCYQAGDAILDLTGAAESKPLAIAVAPAGSIRGRLTGTAKPAEFAVVMAASERVDSANPVEIAIPDAEGRFAFGGLRPGRYRIAAQPAAEGPKARWLPDVARMFEIDVPGGAPTEMELPAPAVTK